MNQQKGRKERKAAKEAKRKSREIQDKLQQVTPGSVKARFYEKMLDNLARGKSAFDQ